MSKLEIYRSSAGSGKTYALVKVYLQLALESPVSFRHILAVTFTNKATQEMKRRIITYLYSLSKGWPSTMATELMKSKGWCRQTLQKRASSVLSNILHHYTLFSVSTIDSFFQTVIRAFAKEVGLQSGFAIETDQAYVMKTIISKVIEEASRDQQLLHWLVELAESKLLSGKKWHFRKEFTILGNALFSERFREKEDLLVKATEDKHALRDFVKELYTTIHHFENSLQRWGDRAINLIAHAGLGIQDFAYGKNGVAGYFVQLKERKKFEPTKRALYALESLEAWYSKSAKKKACISQVVESELQGILKQVVHFYQTQHCAYHTALAVRQFIYAFGITTQLLDKLKDYRDENGVMLISDASIFLRKIIQENDTPFIYEKIGSFYKHFLIDEFQDMSRFQWQNFKPLIENSLAEGNRSLIVGDVKQSIYRWRGGDWNLLLTQVEEAVGKEKTASIYLNYNWRSKQHIIDFNNTFFPQAIAGVVQHFQKEIAGLANPSLKQHLYAQTQQLADTYQKAYQYKPASTQPTDKGYVNITFLADERTEEGKLVSWQTQVKELLPKCIEKLQYDGFALKEIAILVRNHQESHAVVQEILAYKHSPQAKPDCRYQVIAAESLYIGHAPWVNIIVNALKYLADEQDHLAKAELIYGYQQYIVKKETPVHQYFEAATQHHEAQEWLPAAFVAQKSSLQQRSFYELVEALIAIFQLHHVQEAIPFIQAFQDLVLAFSKKEQADIMHFLTWWEERGSQEALPLLNEQDAVKVMTIHQAKGLQFKVVLLPFCAWELDHNLRKKQLIWCDAQAFPFLPLAYGKHLQHTVYAQDYYEEKMKVYLDNLNLLYVALTRAVDRLYAFAGLPDRALNNLPKNTGALLHHVFHSKHTGATPSTQAQTPYRSWEHYWHPATQTLAIGEEVPAQKPTATDDAIPLLPLQRRIINDWRSKLTVQNSAIKFFNEADERATKLNYGRLVHQLLAQIKNTEELEDALVTRLLKEAIAPDDLRILQQKIEALWRNTRVKSWFSGAWEVKNEAAIILPTGKTVRPDRVMVKGKEAIVVDFKTGEKHLQHTKQVQNYAHLLRQMGYTPIQAYLLYIENGDLIAC